MRVGRQISHALVTVWIQINFPLKKIKIKILYVIAGFFYVKLNLL